MDTGDAVDDIFSQSSRLFTGLAFGWQYNLIVMNE
jgi:hypothetical protein